MRQARVARDYMSTVLVTFSPDMDIHRAIKVLLARQISGAPVVDGQGHIVGILSEKDCLQVAFSTSYHQEWGGRVSAYMSHHVQTVEADTDIVAVAELFLKRPYGRFPVVQHHRLVGQISRRDILRALEELW